MHRDDEQRILCIATAKRRQRQSDGDSSADYALLRQRNGSARASRRREQRRRCGEKNASRRRERPQIQATPGTEDASQCESRPDYSSLGRSNGSDRADASRRREQRIHQYVGARAATVHASRWCIGSQTARAAQTMHRYGGATAAIEHASRRREQRRLSSVRRSNGSDRVCIATARAAQTMHRCIASAV